MRKTKAVIGMVENLMDLIDALALPEETRETVTGHLNGVCLQLDRALTFQSIQAQHEEQQDGNELLGRYIRLHQNSE